MKLIIPRSRWLRGEGSHHSYLLRDFDRKMCCVGLLAEACGIEESELLDVKSIHVGHTGLVAGEAIAILERFVEPSSSLTPSTGSQIYAENDAEDMSEAYREQALTKLFHKIGVEVEFTD